MRRALGRSAATTALFMLGACNATSSGRRESVTVNAASSDPGWSALSWEERHDLMTFVVLPNMSRLFQHFRGTPAPEMTCRTCHGEDGERVGYAMPHGLPPLDPRGTSDVGAGEPDQARMAKFMIEEVTPTMANLLGMRRRDPASGQGFSCFNCHPSK